MARYAMFCHKNSHLMWRWSWAWLGLLGCARGPLSYDSTISPVEHRAVRALAGATVTFGAQSFGVKPLTAVLIGTVGLTAASKALLAVQHPERFGPWSIGDAACDLLWSAAVVPLVVARKSLTRGLLTALGWGAGVWAIQRRCVP